MKLFGTSGIRRLYDKELLRLALNVGLAVGNRYSRVIVGRDTRSSGEAMKNALVAGLSAGGAIPSRDCLTLALILVRLPEVVNPAWPAAAKLGMRHGRRDGGKGRAQLRVIFFY